MEATGVEQVKDALGMWLVHSMATLVNNTVSHTQKLVRGKSLKNKEKKRKNGCLGGSVVEHLSAAQVVILESWD